ncbi:hypothetical protein AKN90_04120 [Thiopseudomonas alkaliphila]|uniref:DUF1641 domain-containing protein n=1 Tax=Thiopseudomonas alkaliphila TaxID=1697053 RepID=UPI00069E28D0|nr:DUF1641 domain-containing protein [Thiopseudomonas alkaliphila]AKX54985.1 hypothetical protein AKN90_04120 [Thiopseudomonas alkaliphila]
MSEVDRRHPLESLLCNAPELQDPATLAGLAELIGKLTPLIQGNRLHNIVDLVAATSDVIEMSDDAMVQKLMALYEESIGNLWNLSNTLRYAAAQAAAEANPPSLWQSVRRLNGDADVRRGMDLVLNVLAQLGKQAHNQHQPLPED